MLLDANGNLITPDATPAEDVALLASPVSPVPVEPPEEAPKTAEEFQAAALREFVKINNLPKDNTPENRELYREVISKTFAFFALGIASKAREGIDYAVMVDTATPTVTVFPRDLTKRGKQLIAMWELFVRQTERDSRDALTHHTLSVLYKKVAALNDVVNHLLAEVAQLKMGPGVRA